MSGSPVNLQRDALFTAPEKTPLLFGSAFNFDDGKFLANADPVVYDSYSSARNARLNTVTLANAAHCEAMGLYMRPPGSELSPYRVKCYAGTDDPLVSFRMVVGYAEGTITGTDDDITEYQTYHFDTHLDELIMLEPAVSVGLAPVFFGILLRGVYTTAKVDTIISVQRLATSPPQFSQSVS